MAAEKHREQQPKPHREAGAPREAENQKAGSQGIVRDQRGQEQPADKERAQRTSKGEQNN